MIMLVVMSIVDPAALFGVKFALRSVACTMELVGQTIIVALPQHHSVGMGLGCARINAIFNSLFVYFRPSILWKQVPQLFSVL